MFKQCIFPVLTPFKSSSVQAIARGLSEEESWRLFRQILDALAHMTKLGIVHRDLKPSNLLMGRFNSFTLFDSTYTIID